MQSLTLTAAEKYLPQINTVATAPCIQTFSAVGIISEIGMDMSMFHKASLLPGWAYTAKQRERWEEKDYQNQLGWAYIKPLLVQCALFAIRSKQFPEVRRRYLTLKKRRGHKKAIIAIARMLLTAIYNMLKKNAPYNPELYCKAGRPPAHREISLEYAIYII